MSKATLFWTHVEKRGPEDCWPWTAYRLPAGYGSYEMDGLTTTSQRCAWVLAHGPIPECNADGDRIFVLHRCDNPPCCNPAHLFLGTPADNMADMDAKGRRGKNPRRGELHGRAKLVAADVRAMRAAFAAGEASQSELARRYGVSLAAARFAIIGRNWSHVV